MQAAPVCCKYIGEAMQFLNKPTKRYWLIVCFLISFGVGVWVGFSARDAGAITQKDAIANIKRCNELLEFARKQEIMRREEEIRNSEVKQENEYLKIELKKYRSRLNASNAPSTSTTNTEHKQQAQDE